MLSLYSLSRRRFPVLVALLAILMLFIAPVMSKSLEQHRACDTISVVDSTAPHHSMQVAAHHTPPATDQVNTEAHCPQNQKRPHHLFYSGGNSLMEDIACGYCQLLIHLPLIVFIFIPFIWLINRVSRAPSLPDSVSPLLPAIYSQSQPRAPPACVIMMF